MRVRILHTTECHLGVLHVDGIVDLPPSMAFELIEKGDAVVVTAIPPGLFDVPAAPVPETKELGPEENKGFLSPEG